MDVHSGITCGKKNHQLFDAELLEHNAFDRRQSLVTVDAVFQTQRNLHGHEECETHRGAFLEVQPLYQ